jgi:3-phosphoinositide dependent protein kinase-1
VLLSEDGHLRVVDFGTAKDFNKDLLIDPETQRKRAASFVGTAEYISPELLFDQEAECPVDLWALGVIVFEMLTGATPFRAENEYLIFEKIREGTVRYPANMEPDARDFIERLLVQNPAARLGANGDFTPIKTHPLLEGIEIDNIFSFPPPIIEPTMI